MAPPRSGSPLPPAVTAIRRSTLLLAAALALGLSAQAVRAQSIVYLVRHAEPERAAMGAGATSPDPVLAVEGRARAGALVHVLAEAGVMRVLSTDFNRTRETAAPLAEALGVEVEIYDHRTLESLATRLKETPGRYVVVGHSNTTPRMVELLGGEPGAPIDEGYEFDRLYQVVVDADGVVTTTLLRYGPVSEP